MTRPIILIGGGGHAKVLLDIIEMRQMEFTGYTDFENNQWEQAIYLGDDRMVQQYNPNGIKLVNGIGSTRKTDKRRSIYDLFKARGYEFETLIHPFTSVSSKAVLHEGVQIMAGAVIQTGSRIGVNSIINTKASIDHDCNIGSHVHIAPGATISGGVTIGEGVHIGTGATVIQGIEIGPNSLIAAGAVVVKNVQPGAFVAGVPAKEATK